jgi:PIN domain nuclease of toxin-antitoxin system
MIDYVLDTSALLTLRDDEPGADRVAAILAEAAEGKVRCYDMGGSASTLDMAQAIAAKL